VPYPALPFVPPGSQSEKSRNHPDTPTSTDLSPKSLTLTDSPWQGRWTSPQGKTERMPVSSLFQRPWRGAILRWIHSGGWRHRLISDVHLRRTMPNEMTGYPVRPGHECRGATKTSPGNALLSLTPVYYPVA